MEKKREFDPIKGTFPDPNRIQCRDCFFRDRTELVINGRTIRPGITKDFCAKYLPPPDSNGKPHDVIWGQGKCKYYVKDKP